MREIRIAAAAYPIDWQADFDAYADHYSAVLPLLTGVVRAAAVLSRGGPSGSVMRQAQRERRRCWPRPIFLARSDRAWA